MNAWERVQIFVAWATGIQQVEQLQVGESLEQDDVHSAFVC